MILGDNPDGHSFALRNLVLIELFQIKNNCVTQCTLQVKFLLKLIQKLLEIPFFPIRGISQFPNEGGWSPYCNDFLSKQEIYSI